MLSWDECPEAEGPQSEGILFGKNYGDPGMPTIGQPPRIMSVEQRDRERAEADRKFELRQRIERAAMQHRRQRAGGRTTTGPDPGRGRAWRLRGRCCDDRVRHRSSRRSTATPADRAGQRLAQAAAAHR